MKIVEHDRDTVTVHFAKEEMSDLWTILQAVRQSYHGIDAAIAQVTKERVQELLKLMDQAFEILPPRGMEDYPELKRD